MTVRLFLQFMCLQLRTFQLSFGTYETVLCSADFFCMPSEFVIIGVVHLTRLNLQNYGGSCSLQHPKVVVVQVKDLMSRRVEMHVLV